jgi:two-component system sensor histidine kinase MprB
VARAAERAAVGDELADLLGGDVELGREPVGERPQAPSTRRSSAASGARRARTSVRTVTETVVLGSPRGSATRSTPARQRRRLGRRPPIDVRLRAGELVVRDRRPGLRSGRGRPGLRPVLRGAHARDRPGSGLGLSIVRQAAESHGGTVEARNADGGGAEVVLRLPPRPAAG